MTLSRLELGFESPWGRHLHQTGDTVECRRSPRKPGRIKGSRFFIAISESLCLMSVSAPNARSIQKTTCAQLPEGRKAQAIV